MKIFHYNNIEKKIRTLCIRILKEVIAIIATFQIQILTLRLLEEHILKLVSFMNGTFEGTEFIGTNLKNSKFKNAKFKNAIFEGANLDGTDFKDAKFENTIFLGCKLEKTKNFSTDLQGVRVFEGMPEINISLELEESLNSLMENKYVKASRIFDTKEGNINTLTLMILKENFNEEELIKGLMK